VAGYCSSRALSSPNSDQGWDLAHEARRLAVEFGDRDLGPCALSQIGTIYVEGGKIDDGVPLIDEAMAGALAGEGVLDIVVFISCLMIDSCNRSADFQRVVQWVRAADRFIETYGCPFLNATCRACPVRHWRMGQGRGGIAGSPRSTGLDRNRDREDANSPNWAALRVAALWWPMANVSSAAPLQRAR
jgi:hypothetical protein